MILRFTEKLCGLESSSSNKGWMHRTKKYKWKSEVEILNLSLVSFRISERTNKELNSLVAFMEEELISKLRFTI